MPQSAFIRHSSVITLTFESHIYDGRGDDIALFIQSLLTSFYMKGCVHGDVDASSRATFASKAVAALARLAKGLRKNFPIHMVTTLNYKARLTYRSGPQVE